MQITHAKTNNIPDATQDELDAEIALGNFPVGTTLADIALPSDWNAPLATSMATGKLLGRSTAGTGEIEEIAIGAGLSLSDGELTGSAAPIPAERIAYVDLSGDDATATIGDRTKPYATLQAAYDAISDDAPATALGTLKLGVGNFGNIIMNAGGYYAYDSDIAIEGSGTNTTIIEAIKPPDDTQYFPITIYLNNLTVNNIISSSALSSNTAPAGQNGTTGTDGGNIVIYGDKSVYVGTINAAGGQGQNGGTPDPETTTNGGNGGNGGNVTCYNIRVAYIFAGVGAGGGCQGDFCSPGTPGSNKGAIYLRGCEVGYVYDSVSLDIGGCYLTQSYTALTNIGTLYDSGGNSPAVINGLVNNQSFLYFNSSGQASSANAGTFDGTNIAVDGSVTVKNLLQSQATNLAATQNTSYGAALSTATNATLSVQTQISPAIRWSARAWKSASTAQSRAADFRKYVVPVPGSANITGYLLTQSQINSAGYTNISYHFDDGRYGILNQPTAYMDLPASTTAIASLRIRNGAAPTTPNDGDVWYDGTNLKARIAGATKTFTLT